jgi:hypothetical protein
MLTGIHDTRTCTSSFIFYSVPLQNIQKFYTLNFLAVVLKWNLERNNKIPMSELQFFVTKSEQRGDSYEEGAGCAA